MQYPSNFLEILELLESLSFQAMGYSSPNPPVACVITDLAGIILSSGFTQRVGENHAEREAYQNFAQKFSNYKSIPHLVFVTLEPCTHFGRTAPCIDLILENKPVCVYYGLADPNPIVKQRNGFVECEKIGIQLIKSLEIAKIGETFLSGFISRIENRRPQIFLKSALSKEGFYSDLSKSKISLSNSTSNQISQMLRAKFDAIIVGPITVYVDYPGLDFRGFDLSELEKTKIENSFFPKEELDERNILFTKTLIKELFYSDSARFHNLKIADYQPFRVFVISMKKIPNLGFFQKQGQINEMLGSKKVIFFLLDFDSENVSHQSLYKKISEVSYDLPVVVVDKEKLLSTLFLKFSELSLNTILVEGGNLLYKMFSENLQNRDLIYFIRTDKSIAEGIFPEIELKTKTKYLEAKVKTDVWEVYGE